MSSESRYGGEHSVFLAIVIAIFIGMMATSVAVEVEEPSFNVSSNIEGSFRNVGPGDPWPAFDSLIGFYKFERNISGNGSIVVDYSNSANGGKAYGDIRSGLEGVTSGKAVYFDGEDDYVDLESRLSPHLNRGFTFVAWLKPDSKNGTVMSIGEEGAISLYLDRGSLYLEIGRGKVEIASLGEEKWRFIALNFGRKELGYYIDGSMINKTHYSFGGSLENKKIHIGGNKDYRFFKGVLDELQFYERPLDVEELDKLYFKEYLGPYANTEKDVTGEGFNTSEISEKEVFYELGSTESGEVGVKGRSVPPEALDWEGEMNISAKAELLSDGRTRVNLERDNVEVEINASNFDWNRKPDVEKRESYRGMKDFTWIENNDFVRDASYSGKVVLPDTYSKVYKCEGERENPECYEISEYTEGDSKPYYKVRKGQTHVFVRHFSGVAGASTSSDWNEGSFNGASADRSDNSGNLGIGYLNGTKAGQPYYNGLNGEDLVGYWRMDRSISGTGGTVLDYSGEGVDGTSDGLNTGVRGVFGTNSFDFGDASGNSVDIDNGPKKLTTDSWTVVAWIRPDSCSDYRNIVGSGEPGGNFLRPGGYISVDGDCHLRDYDGNWITSNSAVSREEWSHVAFQHNSSQVYRMFINGSLDLTKTGSTSESHPEGEYYIKHIGRFGFGVGRYFAGRIDEVRVYNRTLSSEEIKKLYFRGRDGVFEGSYNRTNFTVPTGNIPVNLSVSSSNVSSSGNKTVFRLEKESESNVVKLDEGKNTKNYSLSGFSPGGSINVSINMTADLPILTPVVEEFEIFFDKVVPHITVFNPENTTYGSSVPLDVGADIPVKEPWNYSLDGGNNESFTPNTSITGLSGGKHELVVWAQSEEGFWNSTTREFSVDLTPPRWKNQQQEKDTVSTTSTNRLSARAKDDTAVDYAILSTNESGSFKNKTVYGSPLDMAGTESYAWSNFTWDNGSISNATIGWKIWYNDTVGNYNVTDLKSFNVTAQDSSPPSIGIYTPYEGILGSRNISLRVRADEPVHTWLRSVDGGPNQTFEPNTTFSVGFDGTHALDVWANDTSGNWGLNFTTFNVDTDPPNGANLTDNATSVTEKGDIIQINATYRDENSGLYRTVLSTNESGSFVNYTESYGSPVIHSNQSGSNIGSSFFWSNQSFSGVLGYKVWGRDRVGNWNVTSTGNLSVDPLEKILLNRNDGQNAWEGDFNGTSADRDDNSGELGLGYLNGVGGGQTYNNGLNGNSLTGYWRLDASTDSVTGSFDVKDYSGYRNNGTLRNSEGDERGFQGVLSTKAFDFDGTDDHVELDKDIASPDTSHSASMWVNTDVSSNSTGQFFFSFRPIMVVQANMNFDTGGEMSVYDTSSYRFLGSTPPSGTWVHVAWTYNDGTNQWHAYKNGEQVNSWKQDVSSGSGGENPVIGDYQTGEGNVPFDGRIDEVRVYNRSLSLNEVKRLYFRGQDEIFKGNYNEAVNIPSSGTPTTLQANYSGLSSGARKAWISINTTNSESDIFKLDPASNSVQRDLGFGESGGEATIDVNMSSNRANTTPVIERLDLFSTSRTFELNSTVKKSDGSVFENAEITYRDRFGRSLSSSTVTVTSKSFTDSLGRNKKYTVKTDIPVYSEEVRGEINDINLSEQKSVQPQVVKNYTNTLPSEVKDIKSVYALNDSDLDFQEANLTFPKLGLDTNAIVHCTDWDFDQGKCSSEGDWQFNSTEDYVGGQNSTHIWFQVDNFDAFGPAESSTDIKTKEIVVYGEEIVEGEEINISANFSYENRFDPFNVSMSFESYNGSRWILKQKSNKTIDPVGTGYNLTNFTWISDPGSWRFNATADPKDNVSEVNESNNANFTLLDISGYHTFYGNTSLTPVIGDGTLSVMNSWSVGSQRGNIFYSDTDSNYNIRDLHPLNGSDDFNQTDRALDMVGFNDSIQELWDSDNDGTADKTTCMKVGHRELCGVPVINSTNTSEFQTGIFYDPKDGTPFSGSEDIVFGTEVNGSNQGRYGVYNYEIKVPVRIRSYIPSTDLARRKTFGR